MSYLAKTRHGGQDAEPVYRRKVGKGLFSQRREDLAEGRRKEIFEEELFWERSQIK
jgi:hypothetical protein